MEMGDENSSRVRQVYVFSEQIPQRWVLYRSSGYSRRLVRNHKAIQTADRLFNPGHRPGNVEMSMLNLSSGYKQRHTVSQSTLIRTVGTRVCPRARVQSP